MDSGKLTLLTMKEILRLIILVIAVLPCGCIHSTRMNPGAESWLDEPPVEEFDEASENDLIPNDRVFLVPQKHSSHAEILLAKESCIEITSRESSELLGSNIAAIHGSRVFLVRGLLYTGETGRFLCLYYNNKLSIQYCAMRSFKQPIIRQALVILLPNKPTNVVVSCSMMK